MAPKPSALPRSTAGTGSSFSVRPRGVTFVAKPKAAGAATNATNLDARRDLNIGSNGSETQSRAKETDTGNSIGGGPSQNKITGLSSLAAAYSDSEEE